jgi:hypothetical protein
MALLLLAMDASPVAAQIGLDPIVSAPRAGDVLQGTVTVSGVTDVPGFVSAEISFAYADDPTGTWFLITNSDQPVNNATLATWDTTTITDGTYRLRVRVNTSEGTAHETIIPDLRVHNYTSIETAVPPANASEATSLPTAAPTATPFPSPTSLPHNPAALAPNDVLTSVLYGGLVAVVGFVIFGLYTLLRRK